MEKIIQLVEDFYNNQSNSSNGSFGAQPVAQIVFEHCKRVWNLFEEIAEHESIDIAQMRNSLSAAALFHDAGRLDLYQAGKVPLRDAVSHTALANIRMRSAELVNDRLNDILQPWEMERTVSILHELAPWQPTSRLGKILSDADNLEELGIIGIIQQARAGMVTGKTAKHLVGLWQRQQEYHYWEARIKAGFYYETSRNIARTRLQRMEQFYPLLAEELEGGQLSPSQAKSYEIRSEV